MTGESWEVFSFSQEYEDLDCSNNNRSAVSEGTGGKGSQRLSTLPTYHRTPQHRRTRHNCFFPLGHERRQLSYVMVNPNDQAKVEEPPQYLPNRKAYMRSPDIRLHRLQKTIDAAKRPFSRRLANEEEEDKERVIDKTRNKEKCSIIEVKDKRIWFLALKRTKEEKSIENKEIYEEKDNKAETYCKSTRYGCECCLL